MAGSADARGSARTSDTGPFTTGATGPGAIAHFMIVGHDDYASPAEFTFAVGGV